ncbi:ABC transporter permease [Frondihabitans australicus]|uniref:ABC-2 type transport system permease protein n=1 Tax=Frondihabitans australicus TaxID=386892 RepID=A0A495IFC7_9MICO|nr:ABC transporter permease [Frondihabitans australicus]RKR74707.1 ABC-2 type transport system permease protein [Frondihabitans australicus]
MAAQLLRLRLLSIANLLRFGLRQAAATVVTILIVVVASIVVSQLASQLRADPIGEVQALVVGGGALLLVAFFVAPFATTRQAWTAPQSLYGYGFGPDRVALGLGLIGAIGLPALSLVILGIGYVRSWGEGPGIAALAVVAAVLAGLTAWLLALVGATLNGLLTARRSRELLVVGGVVVALLVIPLVVDLVRVLLPGRYHGDGTAAGALAWTPFGAALALPASAAAGDTGRVVAGLVIALVTIAVLWAIWRTLVARALSRPEAPARASEHVGLGWFDLTTASPAGAIAGRSLTYWVRDARYRWSLVILPFVPLLIVPLGIAGVDWATLALVPVPLMCLLLGFIPHNDVAYDNTALWIHISSNTRGLADRLGRLAPPLVIGLPLAVVGSLVAVWLHGDFSAFAPELGVCLSLLLTGLGLASIVSAALPYAAVRPGDDPFQQPQASSPAAGLSQTLMFAGALLLSVPAGWLAVRATVLGAQDLIASAFWTGLGTGIVVLAAGVLLGARVFSRRAPELLAFALRS